MADFQRHFESVDKLQEEILFQSKLKNDCEEGIVFPAVRRGYMSFYYAGGSLFTYKKNEFSTNIKYAFVPKDIKKDYVTQKELKLKSVELEDNFVSGYDKIKERCKLYVGDEAKGVSGLYKSSPMSKPGRYCLVDIEVSFAKEKDENTEKKRNTTDRIDIMLYDNENTELLFCEAKHFLNPEIWAEKGRSPDVLVQLDKYRRQIEKKGPEIVEQYKNHFEVLRKLFGVKLKSPTTIYPHCGLFVFGYKAEQESKINDLKRCLKENWNICSIYTKGIEKSVSAATLYKELTKAPK